MPVLAKQFAYLGDTKQSKDLFTEMLKPMIQVQEERLQVRAIDQFITSVGILPDKQEVRLLLNQMKTQVVGNLEPTIQIQVLPTTATQLACLDAGQAQSWLDESITLAESMPPNVKKWPPIEKAKKIIATHQSGYYRSPQQARNGSSPPLEPPTIKFYTSNNGGEPSGPGSARPNFESDSNDSGPTKSSVTYDLLAPSWIKQPVFIGDRTQSHQ